MKVVEGTFAAENNTEIYTILSTANNGEIKLPFTELVRDLRTVGCKTKWSIPRSASQPGFQI